MAVAVIAVLISTLSANLQQHSTQHAIGSASLLGHLDACISNSQR